MSEEHGEVESRMTHRYACKHGEVGVKHDFTGTRAKSKPSQFERESESPPNADSSSWPEARESVSRARIETGQRDEMEVH